MRANTTIYLAVRNIGDSQDEGKLICAPLRDAILELASHLGQISIARRIVIGIGRNEPDARAAIEVNGAGRAKVTDSMRDSLNALLSSVEFHDHDESDSHVTMGFDTSNDQQVLRADAVTDRVALRDPLDDWNPGEVS